GPPAKGLELEPIGGMQRVHNESSDPQLQRQHKHGRGQDVQRDLVDDQQAGRAQAVVGDGPADAVAAGGGGDETGAVAIAGCGTCTVCLLYTS
ncbi:MAG: hypothetical protein AN481_20030, partial [Aphanizomenon flos-aquae LD13]